MTQLACSQDFVFSPAPGFTVSCLPVEQSPFVHITLTLNWGMGVERVGEHGYFSLLSTLMGRGCGGRDRVEFASDCDSRGANINIYPGRDFLTLEGWVLPQDLEWALHTLAEMVWQPRLELEEVEIATEEQLDQLLARADEKKSRLFDAARLRLYQEGHHYSRPMLGCEASLGEVTASSLRGFHRRLLEDVQAALCLTGCLTLAELEKALSRTPFATTAPKSDLLRPTAPLRPQTGEPLLVPFPVDQAEVLVVLPSVPRWSPDFRLHAFCNEILGGAFLSRLTRAVRIHGGMAYSADSRYLAGLEGGLFWIALQTDCQKVSRALSLARQVMDELVDRPLEPREFEHFKEFVRCSMPFEYDALASLTSRRLEQLLYGEPWQLAHRLESFERQITPDATHQAFQALLRPPEALVAFLGEGLKREDGNAFNHAAKGAPSPVPPLNLVSLGEVEGPTPLSWTSCHVHSKAELHRFSSGLHLLVLPRDDVASISVQVWSMTGAMDEEEGKTGLSHLLEHLMFRGTPRFPDGSFDAVLAQRGGLNNAFTTEDFTVYTSYVTPDGLEDALTLEADRWQNLRISDELFAVEREVVLEERSLRVDCSPLGKAYEALQHSALPGQPYGHPVIGWRDDLENLTCDDIHRHYGLARSTERMLLVLSGGITVTRALELASRCFADLAECSTPAVWPVSATLGEVPALKAIHSSLSERSGYSYLLCCYRFPREGHPDYEACELLSRIVGEGDSCRLYDHFVREKRTFLEVWTSYESQAREHPLLYFGFASAGQFDPKVCRDEVAGFLEGVGESLEEKELAKAKRSWLAEDAFGTDELEDWSSDIASRVLLMPWDEVWRAQERIEAVTLDDLRRVAGLYLKRSGLVSLDLQGQSDESES